MKKLLIELSQEFEIELEEEELLNIQSLGIDTTNADELYHYLEDEIKEVIENELEIYGNSYISIED